MLDELVLAERLISYDTSRSEELVAAAGFVRGWLESRDIERLYITGLHTDCCARHTSGDAFQRGYDMIWVTDALNAFTEEAHKAGLEYFKAWYAIDPERQLVTVEEAIAAWGVEAGV